MAYADILELNRRQPRRILRDASRSLSSGRPSAGPGGEAPQDEGWGGRNRLLPHPEERPYWAASPRMGGETAPQQQIPMTGAASFLAYLGAAPLIAAALVMIADPLNGTAAQGFLVLYGAALLIFFGGVRWGVAVMKPKGPTTRALMGAGLPMFAALPLFAPFEVNMGAAPIKMVVIMTLMIVLLVDDLKATRRGDGAPAWYLGVRAPLTVLIEVAFLVALAAGMRG